MKSYVDPRQEYNLLISPKRATASFDVHLIYGTLVWKGRDSSE